MKLLDFYIAPSSNKIFATFLYWILWRAREIHYVLLQGSLIVYFNIIVNASVFALSLPTTISHLLLFVIGPLPKICPVYRNVLYLFILLIFCEGYRPNLAIFMSYCKFLFLPSGYSPRQTGFKYPNFVHRLRLSERYYERVGDSYLPIYTQ
jgi:hypothetical protein